MKWFLDSTTIRGTLVALIPALVFLFKALGVDVVPAELEQVVDAVVGIVGAIGVVMAIVGRFKKDIKPVGFSK